MMHGWGERGALGLEKSSPHIQIVVATAQGVQAGCEDFVHSPATAVPAEPRADEQCLCPGSTAEGQAALYAACLG